MVLQAKSRRVGSAHHLRKRLMLLKVQNHRSYKKYLPDFSFALRCAFWVWLASLSSRLAVDSDACSSALSQARYAMTRVVLRQKNCQYSGYKPVYALIEHFSYIFAGAGLQPAP